MKIIGPGHSAERGTITVVILVLLALITVLIVANGRALRQVDNQLRKTEKRHAQRLEPASNEPSSPTPPK